MKTTHVLIIDDDPVVHALDEVLREIPCTILGARTVRDAKAQLEQHDIAVILCDRQLPDGSGTDALAESIRLRPDAIRIALAAHADLDDAIGFINEGDISRFLLKPWEDDRVRSVVGEAIRQFSLRREIESFHEITLRQRDELQSWNEVLEGKVLERTEALYSAYEETLNALVVALDSRERATAGHSRRVAIFALHLAQRAGLDPDRFENLYRGALLHDIGKIGIPDSVLLKPGALDDHERTIMEQHVVIGARILDQVGYLRMASDIPRHHHERFDGTGYSRGVKGEAIPIEARIFSIVDVYDALRSQRSYKETMTHATACELIASESGTHFDPGLVRVFQSIPEEAWVRLAESAAVSEGYSSALNASSRVGLRPAPKKHEAA